MNQISFASAEFSRKKKTTRREKSLADMERVVPWARLTATVTPSYPTSGRRGRPPVGLERMLRMVFVPPWYGLADEAHEDAVDAARRCATSLASIWRASRCPTPPRS